ncbi:unnamed protein product [Polarella glacialis]|uniref:Uncharacterized protein n=1 Tax=Polarella glacialis TaxID=89957 RepID=A0A813D5Y0_POLGL|nr:unnamed protein product [Polarella glacialis]
MYLHASCIFCIPTDFSIQNTTCSALAHIRTSHLAIGKNLQDALPAASPRTSGPLAPSSACHGQPRYRSLSPGIRLSSVNASCQQLRPGHLTDWLLPRPAKDSPGTAQVQKPITRHQAQQRQCELPAASPRTSGPLAPSSPCQVQPKDRSLTPGIRLNRVSASCQQPRPGYLAHWLLPQPARYSPGTEASRQASGSTVSMRAASSLAPDIWFTASILGLPWTEASHQASGSAVSVRAATSLARPGHLAHWFLPRPARDSPGTATSHQASSSTVLVRAASNLAPDIWPTGSFLGLPGTVQGQQPHTRHQVQQCLYHPDKAQSSPALCTTRTPAGSRLSRRRQRRCPPWRRQRLHGAAYRKCRRSTREP